MSGTLGLPQLVAQTLNFGISFFQFGLLLPQSFAQNLNFLFQFLDSSKRRFWVWTCHSKLL